MFDFGAKKKTKPEQPWAIQVLTTEYLIEGLVLAENDIFSWLGSYEFTEAFENAPLTSVQIRPTGNLTTPRQSFSQWYFAYCATIVGVIPLDKAATQAALKFYSETNYPTQAIIYAGPYLIRGTILSYDDNIESLFTDKQGFVLVKDAEINNQLPGAQLSGLKTPWLVLNGGMLHGYGIP